jgi:predicted Zn-dependent protease
VYASKLPEFLMTHPVTTSRTADALGRAEQHAYRQTREDLRYHLARIYLVQRQIERPEEAIRELTMMLEDGRYRSEEAVRYGIALAQLRANRPDEAAQSLDKLLKSQPNTVEFIVARANADAARGANAAALKRLDAALAENPSSYALNIVYAETALAAAQPEKAGSRLERFLEFDSDEPRVHQLLSRAAGDQGNRAKGHEHLAEYYYLIGDLEAAILQLEIAAKRPELNFYDASRLESRMAEFKAEQEKQEERRSARP